MCGIIGIFDDNSINESLFDELTVLQHRGQDSAGMATCLDNNPSKKAKLVNDIFNVDDMMELQEIWVLVMLGIQQLVVMALTKHSHFM